MSTPPAATLQTPVMTTSGPCPLPLVYRDASLTGVFFRGELDRARRLMEGLTIEPWPVMGNAVVAVYAGSIATARWARTTRWGWASWRDVADAARRSSRSRRDMRRQDDQGIWVINLAVTSEAARAAGVEDLGVPQVRGPDRGGLARRGAAVKLADELEVKTGTLSTLATSALPVVTYTDKGGRLLRSVFDVSAHASWGRDASVRLLGGDGRRRARWSARGCSPRKPLAAFRTDDFKATLPAGVDWGSRGAPRVATKAAAVSHGLRPTRRWADHRRMLPPLRSGRPSLAAVALALFAGCGDAPVAVEPPTLRPSTRS